MFYDDSYSRTLTAQGGNAATPRGTAVQFAENIDKNPNLLSGGGPTSGPGGYGAGAIDTAQLPLNCAAGACTPVTPNRYLRTNTVFDVARQAGLVTAFSDKHPAAYTLFAGQPGNAITDTHSPEINARVAIDPKQGGKLARLGNPNLSRPRSRTDGCRTTGVDVAVHALDSMLEPWRPAHVRVA